MPAPPEPDAAEARTVVPEDTGEATAQSGDGRAEARDAAPHALDVHGDDAFGTRAPVLGGPEAAMEASGGNIGAGPRAAPDDMNGRTVPENEDAPGTRAHAAAAEPLDATPPSDVPTSEPRGAAPSSGAPNTEPQGATPSSAASPTELTDTALPSATATVEPHGAAPPSAASPAEPPDTAAPFAAAIADPHGAIGPSAALPAGQPDTAFSPAVTAEPHSATLLSGVPPADSHNGARYPDMGEQAEAPPADPALFAHALRIAEALVFASDRPVAPARLQGALPPGCDARAVLTALAAACAGRPVQLVEVAGGFAFRTAPELAPAITRVVEVPRRLPRAAMETLAIVAYHQPVTRAEIEEIRGASLSQSTLELLLDAALIAPRGRKEVPGRPSLWGTTPRFLEQFGLKALSDLPRREELVNEPTLPFQAPQPSGEQTDTAPPATAA